MFAAQIVLDAAAAQVRAREAVGNRAVLRDDANVPRAIDEDAIARQELVDLVELRDEIVEELLELRDERFRQIANLSADARVGGGEARAGQKLEKIIESSRAR